jgi:hypothetical protein
LARSNIASIFNRPDAGRGEVRPYPECRLARFLIRDSGMVDLPQRSKQHELPQKLSNDIKFREPFGKRRRLSTDRWPARLTSPHGQPGRRHSLRAPSVPSLARFTASAVLTLSLGIGGTTAIFTLIHAVMLRSLPVADADSLCRRPA